MNHHLFRRFIINVLISFSLISQLYSENLTYPKEYYEKICRHIDKTWKLLEKSLTSHIENYNDPKLDNNSPIRIYISTEEDILCVSKKIDHIPIHKNITISVLPSDMTTIQEEGLLFLPKSYVTPGGRFNEMYGWDSYFIMLGLLKSGQQKMAQNMIDNLIYQIQHYGTILNSNRTYHLTRSQPPLLTHMIIEFGYEDNHWIQTTLPVLERYYKYWTQKERIHSSTDLARYYSNISQPCKEVEASEISQDGFNHYELAKLHQAKSIDYGKTPLDLNNQETQITFYQGDRAMRESGFDTSCYLGYLGYESENLNPPCLNSLLYMFEKHMQQLTNNCGFIEESIVWKQRAENRKQQIQKFLWDDNQGLFVCYDCKDNQHRNYPYLTTFYPLWAEIATLEQAERVKQNLYLFEAEGGVRMSPFNTGCQWDAPFGWAPLHFIVVEGLRKYGFEEDARRIAIKFLNLVAKEYAKTGKLFEKYDVESQTSDVSEKIVFGYPTNEEGFGWTNGVFLWFYDYIFGSPK